MKKDFNYCKWMLMLILALIPNVCLAALPAESSPLWDMFRNLTFEPPSYDMSIVYLAKIFGVVPGVPQFAGAGTTIVGAVFGVFNAGVLALSGVFLTYTITRVLTETTMDGGAMGKSTTIWTAVRVALSTSLLVPQASGYSMVNGIVMWVVVQSVGLADLTWGYAMDYLKGGAPVYAQSTSMVDYSLINYDVYTGDPTIDDTNKGTSVGSTDVLRSLTCAHVVHDALVKSQADRHKFLADKVDKGGVLTSEEQQDFANSSKTIPEQSDTFSIYKTFESSKALQFPYIKNEASNPLKDYGLNIKSSDIPLNLSGLCGTISYAADTGSADRSKKYE
ncbi:MAG: hypothetical protein KKE11_06670, partial [Gammaproteobacteria bacterium]|nr:hypothetical protein [Gammaproteobacteria bacterium]